MTEPPDHDAEASDDAEIAALDGDFSGEVAERERRALVKAALDGMPKAELGGIITKLGMAARGLGVDKRFAEDIGSDALMLVLEHKAKWDPRKGHLRPFVRRVLQLLVKKHFGRVAAAPEVAPDSDRDKNVPRSDPNIETVKVAIEERDDSNERFAELMAELKDDAEAMHVVRASEKGITKAEDQVTYLKLPPKVVDAARRRIKEAFKRVYKEHPDAPRLRKQAPRGVHAKKTRSTEEGGEE